ncbi:hypothetical protein SVIOM342S_00298 [Streptomyces violaceorubidus]
MLVPAYNEAKCIENTVRSLVASDHPIEVVVIDDGSATAPRGSWRGSACRASG